MPSLLKIIKDTIKSPKKIKELLINGLSTQDEHGATNARNIEVAMTVIANGKNSTDMNGPSPWEKMLDANNHQLGHALFGVSLGMFVIGIGTTIYRKYRALSYDSYDFYLRHLKKEGFSLKTFDDLEEPSIKEDHYQSFKSDLQSLSNQNNQLTAQQSLTLKLLLTDDSSIRKLYWLKSKLQLDIDLQSLELQEIEKLLFYTAIFMRCENLQNNKNRTLKETKEYAKLSAELERIKSILALQVAFNQQLPNLTGIHNGKYRINFANDNNIELITVEKPLVPIKALDVSDDQDEQDNFSDITPNSRLKKALKFIKKLPNSIAEEYVQFSRGKIAGVYRKTWELINLQTMAFWGAWIATNFLVGLSVLGLSITLGWVVLGAAAAPLLIYGVWKIGKLIYQKITGKQALTSAQRAEQRIATEEKNALLQNLKQKVFIEQDQAHKEMVILALQNKQHLDEHDKKIAIKSTLPASYKEAEHVEASTSYQALLGSTAGRRSKWALTGFLGLIGGFVGPQFVFWVAQTFISTLAGTGAIAAHAGLASILKIVAATVGGPIVMLVVGIPTAIFFCLKALAKEHIAQKEHAVNVKNKLEEKIEVAGKQVTKWQHFDKLLAEINALKQSIQQTREKIALSIKNSGHEYSPEKLQALTGSAYNLDNSDPLKHDFFDKQRHKIGKWTRIKQAAKRIFAGHGGTQTGILVTRFLFLGAMFLASVIAGPHAVVAFFTIAAVIGVAVGIAKAINYHIESRQKERARALEQFDRRIEFAEKEVENLRLLNAQLNIQHEQLEPDSQQDTTTISLDAELDSQTMDHDASTINTISPPATTVVTLPTAIVTPLAQAQTNNRVVTSNQTVTLEQTEQQTLPVVTAPLFQKEKAISQPKTTDAKKVGATKEALAHYLDRGLKQANTIVETKKKVPDSAYDHEALTDQPVEPVHHLPIPKVG